ncbi:MAG: PAS domain S-box protein [Candidatus Thermoplasmatota archaeon]|nr:PAS domain S-box protein [Candidatus Thermoplasmatota archaeon]
MESAIGQSESEEVSHGVKRVLGLLSDHLGSLARSAADWGTWDATYQFVDDLNQDYINETLGSGILANLGLNVIAYANSSGEFVFGNAIDDNGIDVPFPADLLGRIHPGDALTSHNSTESRMSGIVLLSEGPMLVASVPILQSSGEGPIRGALIMGYHLASHLEHIASLAQLSVAMERLDSAQMPSDFEAALQFLSGASEVFVNPRNGTVVAGYAILDDVYGNPALVLRTETSRDGYIQARASFGYFLAAILGSGLLIVIVAIISLNRIVLFPIFDLDEMVEKVAKGEKSLRMPVSGNDEIANLAGRINEMLDSIEKSQCSVRESEQKFRELFENANDTIIYIDENGNIAEANENTEKLSGYRREELIGRSVFDTGFFKPEDLAMIAETFRNGIEKGVAISSDGRGINITELEIKHKNGDAVFVEASTAIVKRNGEVKGLLSIVRDISERKRMENAIVKSKKYAENLIETANAMIVGLDANAKITIFNKAAEEITGYPHESVMGKSWFETVVPKERFPHVLEEFKRLTKHGEIPKVFENPIITKSGEERIISWQNSQIHENGNAVGIISFGIDVTDQRKAEQALHESEEKYRLIAENSFDGMFTVGLDGALSYVSPSAERIYGYTREEIVGMDTLEWMELVGVPDAAKLFAEKVSKLSKGGTVINLSFPSKKKDGTPLFTEINAAPIIMNGEFKGIHATVRDITERKNAEEALRESEEKFRSLAEESPNMIFINAKGRVVYANRRCEEIIGYTREEFYSDGFDFLSITASECRSAVAEKFKAHLDGKEVPPYEYTLITKSGKRLSVILSSRLINYGGGTAILGIVTDITERKIAEETIMASEEKYRTLTERMSDILWTMDPNMNTTYVSPSITKVLGFTLEERAKQTIEEQLTPESLAKARETLAFELQRDGEPGVDPNRTINLELEYHHKNGSLVWLDGVIKGIRNGKGEIIGLQGISRDITERKKWEQRLRESEEFHSTLVAGLPDMVLVHKGGVIVYANRATETVLGYPLKESIGTSVLNYVVEKDRPRVVDAMKRRASGENVKDYEIQIRTKSGNIRNVIVKGEIITYKGEKAFLVILIDITERKLAENILVEALARREEMENIVNRSPVIVFRWRNEAGWPVEYVSESIKQFGYSPQEISAAPYARIIHPDDLKRVTAEVSDYAKRGIKEYAQEYRIVAKSGEVRWVEDRTWVRRDALGRITHHQGIVIDMTEKKRAEEAQAQVEAIRRLDEIKTRFISVATHELRTPLVSIKGYSDLVLLGRAGEVSPRVREFISVASRNTDRLIHLTDDLLDIQRIESGRLKIEMYKVDLRDILRHCISEIKPIIESKKQKLVSAIPERELCVMGDAARLEQVFMNILNNASKFTPEGGKVSLDVGESKKMIEIRISDTGIGIKKEDLERIFEPFADIKKKTYIKGTGLGLSVAKGITEAHGGKIIAESQGEGTGAIFTICIPRIPCGKKDGEKNE